MKRLSGNEEQLRSMTTCRVWLIWIGSGYSGHSKAMEKRELLDKLYREYAQVNLRAKKG